MVVSKEKADEIVAAIEDAGRQLGFQIWPKQHKQFVWGTVYSHHSIRA